MYDEIKRDLQSIVDDLEALGTMPLNAENISMQMAYDKHWGDIASAAKTTIFSLERMLVENATVTEIHFRAVQPYTEYIRRQSAFIAELQVENEKLKDEVMSLSPNKTIREYMLRVMHEQACKIDDLQKEIDRLKGIQANA